MTNLELCDAVAEECKEILKDYKLLNARNEYANINVYTQNLPAKVEKKDTNHYPYVLICFDDESIDDETEVNLYFLIGVKDDNPNNQGYRDVLGIANKLYISLFSRQVIKRKYRMDRKCKIALQQEDTFPYFLGGISTTWYLPETVKQISDDLV